MTGLFKHGVGVIIDRYGIIIQWVKCYARYSIVQTLYSDNVYPSSFVEFVAKLFLGSFFVVDCSGVDGHLGVCSCGSSF